MKAGWEVKALGEVATFVMGQAPAGSDCNKDGIGTPFVKAGEFGESRPVIREWTTDPKKFAKDSDVLICVVGATCGKINLGANCAIGRSAAAIRPVPNALDQFYLHYYLEGQVQTFRAGSLGAAQTVISREMLSEMALPLPPLNEQKRIVEVLDAAFEGLTRARAHTETNLQNARELFESFTREVIANCEIQYEAQSLAAIADNLDRRRVPITKGDRVAGDIPYYGASGIVDYVAGHLFDEELLLISEDGANLLARSTPIAFAITGKTWVNNHAHILRFSDRNVQQFVSLYLNSISLAPFVSGMAQPKLNQQEMNRIPIPLPNPAVCAEIVSKAEALVAETSNLQSHYRAKLADLDALRQSLLQKAFAGELT